MTQRPTLTLRDIADAAHVERAVVSMWRRRPVAIGGRVAAFPDAAAVLAGVEHFDRDDVLEYLVRTGRGTNPDVAQDVLALSIPEGVALDDVVTLLCLHALTGEDLSSGDVWALAARADSRDELLLREVRAMALSDELMGYVDELVEGSFGPSDALERLERSRLRRAEGLRGLSAPLVELLSAVVVAARDVVGADEAVLVPAVDPAVLLRLAVGFSSVVLADRALQRRALVDEMPIVLTAAGPAVHVLSVVGMSEADALRAADELVVELGPADVGVVVGAAAVLCDALVGEPSRDRTTTLDGRALAVAVRLPRGLWKGAHRQSLALWVLHGARGGKYVSVADLETETIDPAELAADVTAALLQPGADAVSGRRAPRYARRVDVVTMLGQPAVVPRGVRALRFGAPGTRSYLDRIVTATLTTSRDVAGCDVVVAEARARIVRRRRSLAELAASDQVAMRRGRRIDRAHADPAGTVVVLSADGSYDDVRLDPFDAERFYSRATRTERGDVVILEKPVPRARVDRVGGALVAAPSRILRLAQTAPIGPHVLAAVVTTLAASGSDWQTWSVPELPDVDADALDAVLAELAAHQDELRRHAAAATDLVATLIEGVAAGAVTLDPTLTRPEAG